MDRQRLVRKSRSLYLLVEQLQLPFLAAAIAYYAFVSVLPLLIVTLTVATVVAGDALATQVLESAGGVLTPEAATVLEQALRGGTGREEVTVVGLLVLLWTGLRLFRGIDTAFSRIYGFETTKSTTGQVRDAAVTLLAIAFAIAATVSASAFIPFEVVPFAGVISVFGMLVVLPLVFFPLYYVLPDGPIAVREAVPGALFAGLGWTVLGTVFGLYTQFTNMQVYGLLGGVLLLVIWFYFAGQVVLLGATLNAYVGGQFEDRQLQQAALRDES